VAAGFGASRLPYAAGTWTRVAGRLDDYGNGWVAMHTEACRATRVDGDQSEHVLELRMTCLERRRAELAALVGQLARADDDVVEHAMEATSRLSPVIECADRPALLARAASRRGPPVVDGTWQVRITDVKAQYDVGRWNEGLAAATALTKDADAHGDTEVRAEAWGWLGRLQSELHHDFKSAEPSLENALRLAAEAGDDTLAAHVVTDLVYVLDDDKRSPDQALVAADIGLGFVARAGNADILRAELLIARGDVLDDLARYEDARVAFVEAIALLGRHVPADDFRLGRAVVELASNRTDAGAYDDARVLYQRTMAIFATQLGADHPKTAQLLNKLGLLAEDVGHFEEALADYRRALDIKERVVGADSVSVAHTVTNIANVMGRLGRTDEAAAGYERALAIYQAKSGPEHPSTVGALTNLGNARRQQGRLDEALDLDQRALAIALKVNGPDSPVVATSRLDLGYVLVGRGDFAGASAQYRLGIAARSKALGADHPDTLSARTSLAEALIVAGHGAEARAELQPIVLATEAKLGKASPALIAPLTLLARCEVDGGHAAIAAPIAERALALALPLGIKGELDPEALAVVRFELARALWDSGGDRARAGELAAGAEPILVSPSSQRDHRRVVAWRRLHVVVPAPDQRR
jgi:tetratricopeptide (TPR) repeat protein